MEKNSKGQVIIQSIDELASSQRKQLKKTSAGVGLLVLLIGFLFLLLMDAFPDRKNDWFVFGIDMVLITAVALAMFDLGYALGFRMKLADMGFAFAKRPYSGDYYHASHQPYSSSDSGNHFYSGSHGSPSSINPSSGKPMSGSSGVDISGNPFGTRSW